MKVELSSYSFFIFGMSIGMFSKAFFDWIEKFQEAKMRHWDLKIRKALVEDILEMEKKLKKQ